MAVESVCRQLFDASPDCVKLLDDQARLLWINAPGCRLMDIIDPTQLIGSAWVDFWAGEGRAAAEAAVATARSGGIGRFSGPCPTAAGRDKWWDVIVLGLPVPIAGARLLVVSRDVTEFVDLLERERTLVAAERGAREEAMRATAERDAVMASVSHQIRTPLNTILGCAVLLQADPSPAARATGRQIHAVVASQVAVVDRLIANQDHSAEPAPETSTHADAGPSGPVQSPMCGPVRVEPRADLTGVSVTLVLADRDVDAAFTRTLRSYGATACGADAAADAWPFDGAVVDVEQGHSLAWLAACRARYGDDTFWCVAVTSDRSAAAARDLRAQGFVDVVTRPATGRDVAAVVMRAHAAFQESRTRHTATLADEADPP